MARTSKTRPPADDSPLAREMGQRLRRARLAASMTQQQLADGRFTKAYVSALENGLSRPSMAALRFFSGRLGIAASSLINDHSVGWHRLEADLALASGRWEEAADAYRQLLDGGPVHEARAELLRGLAEALVRLGKGKEATAFAAEAARLFTDAGRGADAALAEYWLSSCQYQQDNTAEAKAILRAILARVRGGLKVDPDFTLRLLMAISSNESREGNHSAALAYLEEVRGLAADLDDRRRAAYLYDLADSYRETGDYEAALRAGIASLELYRHAQADRETATLENDLALSYLALGNASRADDLAGSSRRTFERLGDERALAHVIETQARIALAGGAFDQAARQATAALGLAEGSKNPNAIVQALLTRARARTGMGDMAGALVDNEQAGQVARQSGTPTLLRQALGQWADALALSGDHERAFTLMREALGTS
ncbi:MAG TPA: helix-turn-helix transcriptional regulator [Candidatus Limnocylindrales bacterium]